MVLSFWWSTSGQSGRPGLAGAYRGDSTCRPSDMRVATVPPLGGQGSAPERPVCEELADATTATPALSRPCASSTEAEHLDEPEPERQPEGQTSAREAGGGRPVLRVRTLYATSAQASARHYARDVEPAAGEQPGRWVGQRGVSRGCLWTNSQDRSARTARESKRGFLLPRRGRATSRWRCAHVGPRHQRAAVAMRRRRARAGSRHPSRHPGSRRSHPMR